MSAYFGNGYFLNVLQRGATPVGNARSKQPPSPIRLEETVARNQPSDPAGVKSEAQKSLDHPASTGAQPSKADPLAESITSKEPEPIQVTTRFPSREVEEISSGTTTRHSQDEETSATLRSDDPLEANESSLQVSPSPFEPSVHKETSRETPQTRQSTSQIFELRMPENFFGHRKDETSSSNQVKRIPVEPVVSAPLDRQAETQSAVEHSSTSAIPAKTHAEAQSPLNAVLIPKHEDKLQTSELTPRDPIAARPFKAQPVAGEVMDHVKQNDVQPSKLMAPQTSESSAPTPRTEQSSQHLQLRQPSIAPAPVVVPPARLQINRIDIQVVNQPPAPPPPAHAPDVSQLLEKHLGRVELLL
jgi:hypothetical protein